MLWRYGFILFGGYMGYQFWILRAIKLFVVLLVIFFTVQLLKQNSIEDSIIFAATWSFLSTSVFIGARLFQSRRGIECALCKDTPNSNERAD